jgi:hypothetical protein
MTSVDLKSRSRTTINELNLYLGVKHLSNKAELAGAYQEFSEKVCASEKLLQFL